MDKPLLDWQIRAIELKFKDKVSWNMIRGVLNGEYPDERLSYYTIRWFLRRTKEYKSMQKIKYIDKKEIKPNAIEDYMDVMCKLQEAEEAIDDKQITATVQIDSDRPIGIALWGDWHMGASGTDYKRFNEDKEKIINTDGLYWVGMGDYKDNYQSFGHKGAQYEQIIQPGMQDKLVKKVIKETAENNIALIRGCHDDWDYKASNLDFISTLCEISGSINLWHGGDLFIELGGIKYHFKLRHKYPFESSLNVENSARRMMELQGVSDVAGTAHKHNPFTIQRYIAGEFRILCRSGSYKMWDEFGQKLAGYKGKSGVPVIILFPKKKKIMHMMLEDAIGYLEYLRK
jgi:hypothetical protein